MGARELLRPRAGLGRARRTDARWGWLECLNACAQFLKGRCQRRHGGDPGCLLRGAEGSRGLACLGRKHDGTGIGGLIARSGLALHGPCQHHDMLGRDVDGGILGKVLRHHQQHLPMSDSSASLISRPGGRVSIATRALSGVRKVHWTHGCAVVPINVPRNPPGPARRLSSLARVAAEPGVAGRSPANDEARPPVSVNALVRGGA